MHDAGHIAPAFGLDRHHIAAVAHGDDGVHQVFGRGRAAHNGIELIADAVVQQADVAADIGKGRAGVIADFILGQDGIENVLLQAAVGVQQGAQARQQGGVLAVGHQGGSHQAGGLQGVGHLQQALGRERGADLGQLQMFAHIGEIGHGVGTVVGQHRGGLLGFRLAAAHQIGIAGGRYGPGTFPAHGRGGKGGHAIADLAEFQHAQVSFIHGYSAPRK